MHRFFVPQDQIPVITGSDAHQIKNVLRMKSGDKLELLDGSGEIYTVKISELKRDNIVCEIISERSETIEQKVSVTIAQCLPKTKKMDLIIQKCTELGVNKIIPTLSERSIAKGDKSDRWKKIAKEAAEQSGRATIPEIDPLTEFGDLLKLSKDYDLALIPWELEQETTLKHTLTTTLPHYILILIGSEGGFSKSEIDLAVAAGFKPTTLGKNILRTETAGMSILSMINYQYNL
ncbi:MAG: RsmE family RNA methyltransferase [Candidatus Margulisiibacteriota bacterium]|nr:RsmE family RNA methyltransferase [Candidatus Margulisiibacteriota bacterium]